MDLTIHISQAVFIASGVAGLIGCVLAAISLVVQEFYSLGGISSIADKVTARIALLRIATLGGGLALITAVVTFLITTIF